MNPRDAIDRALFASIGAAAITRERLEGVVTDLASRGHMGTEEAAGAITRLAARVRGEGPPSPPGIAGRIEDGAQAAFRELGLVTRSDLEELRLRVAELERRLSLLEAPSDPPGGD